MATINRKAIRRRIHLRIRKKVNGTTVRPRLAVHFSNKNVYVQLIDDEKRCTLASASTREKGSAPSPANVETATRIGGVIAERALALGVTAVVFDRGGFVYHGKVKALADAAREKGLIF
jgi:large subunit ribosomal protein L18